MRIRVSKFMLSPFQVGCSEEKKRLPIFVDYDTIKKGSQMYSKGEYERKIRLLEKRSLLA